MMKNLLSCIALILLLILVVGVVLYNQYEVQTLTTMSQKKVYVALVIDDFGNDRRGVKEMLDLDIPITVAVMPFLPRSVEDAKNAHRKGFDVLLHMPMEPNIGKKEWLGKKAITSNLDNNRVEKIINEAFDEIKFAIGMNNHMGSKITQNERIMSCVFKVLKERNMFFLDSKTASKTISSKISAQTGVICLERDIFLDNNKTRRSIQKQMSKLATIAHKKGYAIGIGHVGPEGGKITAQVIKDMSKKLEMEGIEFIRLSQVRDIILNK